VQHTTCKLNMTKCSWNVVKLNNSCNVWGWKRKIFILMLSWFSIFVELSLKSILQFVIPILSPLPKSHQSILDMVCGYDMYYDTPCLLDLHKALYQKHFLDYSYKLK
jgi:hypothetical protein